MRPPACRPSARRAVAALVLLVGVSPAAAELIVTPGTLVPARHTIAAGTNS